MFHFHSFDYSETEHLLYSCFYFCDFECTSSSYDFLIHSIFTPLSHFVVFLNLLVSCLLVLLMVGRGSTEVKKSYVVIHTLFFLLFVVKLSPGFPLEVTQLAPHPCL